MKHFLQKREIFCSTFLFCFVECDIDVNVEIRLKKSNWWYVKSNVYTVR